MEGLTGWRLLVTGAAAVVFLGGMQVVVWRLLGRRSPAKAASRPGSDVESMLYGALAPEGTQVFDGFSYRVSARFAGRSRLLLGGDRLVFCGPRGPRGLYVFWIWLQATLLAAAPVAGVWAVATLAWGPLLLAVALLVASVIVMAIGAGVWPGLGEVPGLGDGHMPALEMALGDIRGVKYGPGWADGGLSIILIPYVGGIDKIAVGHAVSWWGPDEDGREARFAFHCYDTSDADRLFSLLHAASSEQHR